MLKRPIAAAATLAAALLVLCVALCAVVLVRAGREPSRITALGARAYAGHDRGAKWELHLLALAGRPRANLMIGEATLDGAAGVPPAEGLPYLRRAAEAGDRTAQRVLGKALLRGRGGIAKEPSEASRWLQAAAEAGDPAAAYYLGVLYRTPGVPGHSLSAAIPWLRRAADQHLPAALFVLGNAYRSGAGVAMDERKALDCYTEAAELDHPESIQALAMAYQQGELGLAVDPEKAAELIRDLEHAIHDAPANP
ncbi:tetratricopeptide repeat protein [Corallococcus sp. Z5C101001]|uniref:tetratricopeptide repeat protein n=1 Tax=Corallococcus sp. Z5C101001 TaxID=2596829 RepID=UPI00117F9656|nr:tetratricopeptide repeat protein [Corallococcus sp. Z5C101001]TSC34238.1 sel1 repeat family protein [Corallococcus sp. Z5C101001]